MTNAITIEQLEAAYIAAKIDSLVESKLSATVSANGALKTFNWTLGAYLAQNKANLENTLKLFPSCTKQVRAQARRACQEIEKNFTAIHAYRKQVAKSPAQIIESETLSIDNIKGRYSVQSVCTWLTAMAKATDETQTVIDRLALIKRSAALSKKVEGGTLEEATTRTVRALAVKEMVDRLEDQNFNIVYTALQAIACKAIVVAVRQIGEREEAAQEAVIAEQERAEELAKKAKQAAERAAKVKAAAKLKLAEEANARTEKKRIRIRKAA
jgi:hypothetical protein